MPFDLDEDEYRATRILTGADKPDEIKVGEYIRTKSGTIIKVTKTNIVGKYYYLDIKENRKIVKHSSNIIDLIEVGDYVNGNEVEHIDNCLYGGEKVIITELNKTYYDNQINSIVTKEKFASMEYKIGG